MYSTKDSKGLLSFVLVQVLSTMRRLLTQLYIITEGNISVTFFKLFEAKFIN